MVYTRETTCCSGLSQFWLLDFPFFVVVVLFIFIFLIVLYTTHVLIFVLFYLFIQLLQFRPDEIVMESKAIATGGGGQVCQWDGCKAVV